MGLGVFDTWVAGTLGGLALITQRVRGARSEGASWGAGRVTGNPVLAGSTSCLQVPAGLSVAGNRDGCACARESVYACQRVRVQVSGGEPTEMNFGSGARGETETHTSDGRRTRGVSKGGLSLPSPHRSGTLCPEPLVPWGRWANESGAATEIPS